MLGIRTRKAYSEKNIEDLKMVARDYGKCIRKLEKFHESFKALWFNDNKPNGFDVQDIRLGGLKQRLLTCKGRLEEYIAGKIETLPELDEELIDVMFSSNGVSKAPIVYQNWKTNSSINVI